MAGQTHDGSAGATLEPAPVGAASPRLQVTPGLRLGPYEILELLGSGAMGEIFAARDTRLGRKVAVKVLPPAGTDSVVYLRRFENEARAVAALSHPNILAVFDVGTHEGTPYIVFELLEGETLRQRLQRERLTVAEAVAFTVQIARGLAAAHDKGIVHRDLKPENVFITAAGELKVLDFGLAKLQKSIFANGEVSVSRELTEEGLLIGTVLYMSPEQARGQSVDLRSDLFSLGVMLYEMVAGTHPFRGATVADSISNILRDEPPPRPVPAELPAGVDEIIRRCLNKRAAERFQSAHDLIFTLEWTGARPPEVAPARAAPRTRRRLAVVVPIGLAIATAAAAAVATWPRARPPTPPITYNIIDSRVGEVRPARFVLNGQAIIYNVVRDGVETLRLTDRESHESRLLLETPARLLAVSAYDELAVLVDVTSSRPDGIPSGTLARLRLAGGGPRPVVTGVYAADFAPSGVELAVARTVERGSQLEYPIGRVLYRSQAYVRRVRVSRDGERVAFHEQRLEYDSRGVIGVVDREGRVRVLSAEPDGVSGMSWSPDGHEIWLSTHDEAMWAVSLAGRRRPIGHAPGKVVIQDTSEHGEVLSHLGLSRDDMRAGHRGDPVERDLSWRDFSVPMSMSDDARTFVFTDFDSGYVLFLRGTDGAPAIRLGAGEAGALSPDGKWVLAHPPDPPRRLSLIPTGAGEPVAVTGDALDHSSPRWLPDGQGFLFVGRAPDGHERVYRQDGAAATARPVTPEGSWSSPAVSPDGARLAVLGDHDEFWVFPLVSGGEEPRRIAAAAGLSPIRFTEDGSGVYAFRVAEDRGTVSRIDVATGTLSPWLQVRPPGAGLVWRMLLAADGESYLYGSTESRSTLMIVSGVK